MHNALAGLFRCFAFGCHECCLELKLFHLRICNYCNNTKMQDPARVKRQKCERVRIKNSLQNNAWMRAKIERKEKQVLTRRGRNHHVAAHIVLWESYVVSD